MRTLAFLFGLLVFAGLVVMAVAGFPGARALLATGLGIVAIIALGVQMGGRHGSSGRRQRFEGDPPAGREPAGPEPPGHEPPGPEPAGHEPAGHGEPAPTEHGEPGAGR